MHAARWLLEDFANGADEFAQDKADKQRLRRVVNAIRSRDSCAKTLRSAAWAIAGRVRLDTHDFACADAFHADFGSVDDAERRLSMFEPAGHDGDDMRFARVSLESLLIAAGEGIPDGGYMNLPLIVFWAGLTSSALTASKEFVDQLTSSLGVEGAERMIRYCTN